MLAEFDGPQNIPKKNKDKADLIADTMMTFLKFVPRKNSIHPDKLG